MKLKRFYPHLRWIGVGLSLAAITVFIYYSESHQWPFFATLRYLYAIPITYVALRYGRRAGMGVALLVTSLFLPIVVTIIMAEGLFQNLTLELAFTLVMFNVIAALGGGLADRAMLQKERYRTLNQLSEVFGRELQRDELARIILNETQHALLAESGALWLCGLDISAYHLVASIGPVPTPPTSTATDATTDTLPLVAWLLRHNTPLRVENPTVDPRFLVPRTTPPIHDVLAMPLRRAGVPFGAIILYNRQFHTFNTQDLDLLAAIVTKSELALDNAELYQTLEMRVQERTQDLAAEKHKLSVVFDSIADGLVVLDCDHTIQRVNRVIVSFFGYETNAIIGQNAWDIFPNTALQTIVEQALNGTAPHTTGDIVLPNGTVLRTSVGLLGGVGEDATGVVLVLRNITHELAAQRMMTDFVTMTSHELRTPLTGIMGFAHLIQKQFRRFPAAEIAPANHKWHRTARRIEDNLAIIIEESHRLAELIAEVLDIAKLEAGRLDWAHDQVILSDLIQDTLNAYQSRKANENLHLQTAIDTNLPSIHGDAERLSQVLNNLLSNAIKFTDTGTITVRAWQLKPGETIPPTTPRAPDTETGLPTMYPVLAVSVQDSGVGINTADLPHVFAKFKQVGDIESGTRRQGTGLGLPICREIIQHHGGHIWVESAPGQGSRFVFTLPLEANLMMRNT